VPVICYLYILFYALRGSKPNSERYALEKSTELTMLIAGDIIKICSDQDGLNTSPYLILRKRSRVADMSAVTLCGMINATVFAPPPILANCDICAFMCSPFLQPNRKADGHTSSDRVAWLNYHIVSSSRG
jgi:hypothetical protein